MTTTSSHNRFAIRLQLLALLAICASFGNVQANEIETLLATDQVEAGTVAFEVTPLLREIYRNTQYKALWNDKSNIHELLELIQDADEHGLSPGDYYADSIEHIKDSSAWGVDAASDILLTEALLLYGSHRRYGKVRATDIDGNINYRRDPISTDSPDKIIKLALSGDFLKTFMEMAAPSGPFYRAMQQELSNFRSMADTGGWPAISDGPTLRLGDTGPRVAQIRSYLRATGDLDSASTLSEEVFDETLDIAVRQFQGRHLLTADGIAGRQTFEAMAVPLSRRIDQMRLTLERLRWVNQEATDTLVAVNIAGYRAFYIEGGEQVWETRAMVGKHYRQTPVFRGDIAYMEFNPTWTIPPGILRNDTLPAIKRDPNYLASKNIRVLDRNGKEIDPATVDWHQYRSGIPYTLRQDPGPWNSLGTVKFIFPNSHFVFLHDTPNRELFNDPQRAFSSGCVRVENPLTLAEHLLHAQSGESVSDLQAIIDSRVTQRIHLKPKIPVIILYLTASMDENGRPLFYPDVYSRDDKLLQALNGKARIQLAGQ